MSATATQTKSAPLAHRHASASIAAPALLWTFAVTLFVSALLLFSVQPLFARLALPRLGGAPAVWAVSMCFFQAMLLAGYCYAYALIRFCAPRTGIAIHATLLLVALSTLPISLPTTLGDPPAGDAYLWLLGVLCLGVGLPFFAVAANAPLLQAWFARTGHPAAKDPYFLYGASNAGSLLALLAYPTLIEPWLGLHVQAQVWAGGFALLAVLLMASAAWMLSRDTGDALTIDNAAATSLAPSVAHAPVTHLDRLWWTALALIPSALMVAVTTYITTDLASAPLFWVIPLALFLGTFIVVFREHSLIPTDLAGRLLPLLFVGMLSLPYPGVRLVLALAAFVTAALVCHRQLYERRPAPRHLTEYYLWMSFGGALGGIFSALLAPQIFVSAYEFTLLMSIALFCRADVVDAVTRLDLRRITGITCLLASGLVVHLLARETGGEWAGRAVMAIILVAWIFVLWLHRTHPALQAGVMLGIGLFAWMLPTSQQAIVTARSFFGVVRVIETPDGSRRLMQHGTTLHGSRRLRTTDGATIDRPIPATYYHAAGPLSRGVMLARRVTTGTDRGAIRMGVVGLGTGSLACTTQPGDDLTYFEIDPVVAAIAQNPAYFDFLSRCRPGTPIVMGDARLTLARTNARFDYLVIDAFTSDAVPSHLLTTEAMKLYLDRLAPHGVLALHVSNRYLDLATSVVATAQAVPHAVVTLVEFPGLPNDPDAQPSTVVFVAHHPAALAGTSAWADAHVPAPSQTAPWTDDYSDVLSAFARHLMR